MSGVNLCSTILDNSTAFDYYNKSCVGNPTCKWKFNRFTYKYDDWQNKSDVIAELTLTNPDLVANFSTDTDALT